MFICNLGHWHLCYPPLVGIGKFEDRLTLLGPKSKTRFLFQIRSQAIGKIEKGLKDDEYEFEVHYTDVAEDRNFITRLSGKLVLFLGFLTDE